MRITLGRLHLAVTKQLADHLKRCAAAYQQRGKGMAQIMDAHVLDTGVGLNSAPEPPDLLHRLAQRVSRKMPRAVWKDILTA